MSKFIVLYRAPQSEDWASATPEEMQKGMEPWMAWAERCGSALVDMGSPLGGGQRLTPAGDGDAESMILGYSMLEAEDMAAARALLDGHPHLEWGPNCEIDVYECVQMGGG